LPFRVRGEDAAMPEPNWRKSIIHQGDQTLVVSWRKEEAAHWNNRTRLDSSCVVWAVANHSKMPMKTACFCLNLPILRDKEFEEGENKTLRLPTLILRLRHVMQPVFVRFLTSFLCLPPEMMLFGSEVGAIGNLEPAEATAMGAAGPPTY
jgi:hypothetical protein